MLYTKKGDKGKTSIFACNQKISKSTAVAEALGVLDEVNSYLGVVKAKISDQGRRQPATLTSLIHKIQENLFIIQAEVAGAEKNLKKDKISEIEKIINKIEKDLPEIKTFFISGATSLSAELDFSRTLARRAERRVVAVYEENLVKISPNTLIYLNRLSSLLYALARQEAHKSDIKESAPSYK